MNELEYWLLTGCLVVIALLNVSIMGLLLTGYSSIMN